MKKLFLQTFAAGFFLTSLAWALPETRVVPVDHHPMGVWQKSRSFRRVTQQGVRTFFMPQEQNFFSLFAPENYRSGRVVAVHGTGGNPYEEMKDEIPMAKEFDYMVVGINWFDHEKKGFMSVDQLYRQIQLALV